jgi:hypothetical protein
MHGAAGKLGRLCLVRARQLQCAAAAESGAAACGRITLTAWIASYLIGCTPPPSQLGQRSVDTHVCPQSAGPQQVGVHVAVGQQPLQRARRQAALEGAGGRQSRAPSPGAALGAMVATIKIACVICQGGCNGSWSALKCGHALHAECLQKWLAHGSGCPTCRVRRGATGAWSRIPPPPPPPPAAPPATAPSLLAGQYTSTIPRAAVRQRMLLFRRRHEHTAAGGPSMC